MKLNKDPDTNWVTLAGAVSWKDQADAIKPKVLEVINASDEPLGTDAIKKEVGGQRSIVGAAAKALFRDGQVNMEVTKANKHLFSRKLGQGEMVYD